MQSSATFHPRRLVRAFAAFAGIAMLLLGATSAAAQESAPATTPTAGDTTAATPAKPDEKAAKAAVYAEPSTIASDKRPGYGAETSFLTWHGYLNFEYFDEMGKPAAFDNHEFYLSTQATVSKKLSLTAEFEYEHTPEKLILPIQAFADYQIAPALTFRAGLFYTPLGLARTYNLRGNKNRMVRQVGVTHDIMFENWSEMGINAFGELNSGLYYDVAVTNGITKSMGTGDSWFDADGTLQDHTEDNNDNKAVHAKLGWHAKQLLGGEMNLGLSAVDERYDVGAKKRLVHKAVDLRYLHRSGMRFQGEAMWRSGDDNPADLTAKGISADARGWYAQVSRRFVVNNHAWMNYFEPVYQADYIDLNTHAKTNGDKLTHAVGLVFSPEPYYLLKFEYDFVNEQNGAALRNNKLWFSVVLEF